MEEEKQSLTKQVREERQDEKKQQNGAQDVNCDRRLAGVHALNIYCLDQLGLAAVPEGLGESEENDSWNQQSLKNNDS